LFEGPDASDHHEHGDHENQKTLTKRKMYYAMNHRWATMPLPSNRY
jgi:hypothetical protein